MTPLEKQEMPPRVHVIKRGNGWALKRQGATKATKVFETKAAAVEAAQKMLASGFDLIIHKIDGSVEQWKKAKLVTA
jgi:Uncharacterized protein conserved in bacteria (DUF2188)